MSPDSNETSPVKAGATRKESLMAYFRNNSDNKPLTGKVYVVKDSSISIKVNGLGPNKKPLFIKAIPPGIVDIEHKPSSNPKIVQLEQTIRITGKALGTASLSGYTDAQNSSAQPECTSSNNPAGCISPLIVEVMPYIELSMNNTEEDAIAHMLLAESIGPGRKNFKEEESLKAMQWMRIVLENRLAFSHPQLLQVPPGATSLLQLIKGRRVIEGFENYPNIGKTQKTTIDGVVKEANNGGHPLFLQFRSHVQNAIDVAQGKKAGTDPCPTKLYAWVTAGTSSPSSNFVKYVTLAGQDFYTLTREFLNDPLQRKKK